MKKYDTLLTEEFLEQNTVVFIPRTMDESFYIQQELAELGCKWMNEEEPGMINSHPYSLECVHVKKKIMTHGFEHFDFNSAYYCDLSNLPTYHLDQPKFLSDEQKWFVGMFNKMAKRIEKLEKKLDAIENPPPISFNKSSPDDYKPS